MELQVDEELAVDSSSVSESYQQQQTPEDGKKQSKKCKGCLRSCTKHVSKKEFWLPVLLTSLVIFALTIIALCFVIWKAEKTRKMTYNNGPLTSLKYRFPDMDFDLAAGNTEKMETFLKHCNAVFAKEDQIECIALTRGSVIVELLSNHENHKQIIAKKFRALTDINNHPTTNGHFYTEDKENEKNDQDELKKKIATLETTINSLKAQNYENEQHHLSELAKENQNFQDQITLLKSQQSEERAHLEEQNRVLENENASLRTENQNLPKKIATLETTIDSLKAQNDENEQHHLSELAKENQNFQDQITLLKSQQSEERAHLEEQNRVLENKNASLRTENQSLPKNDQDELKQEIARLKTTINSLRAQNEENQQHYLNELAKENQNFQNQFTALQGLHRELEEKNVHLEANNTALRRENPNLSIHLQNIKQLEDMNIDLEAEKVLLYNQINELQGKNKKLEYANAPLNDKIQVLSNQLEEIQAEKQQLTQSHADKENTIKSLKDENNLLESEVEKWKRLNAEEIMQKDITLVENELLKNQLEEIQRENVTLTESNAENANVIKSFQHKLETHRNEIDELTQINTDNKNYISSSKNAFEKIQVESKELRKINTENANIIKSLEDENNLQKSEVERLKGFNEHLTSQSNTDKNENVKNLEKIQHENCNLKDKLAQSKEENESLKNMSQEMESKLSQIQLDVNESQKKSEELEKNAKKNESEMNTLLDNLRQVNSENESLKEISEDIQLQNNALNKQLTIKDSVVQRQFEDLNKLTENNRFLQDTVNSANQSLSLKEKEMNVLTEKLHQSNLENESLNARIEEILYGEDMETVAQYIEQIESESNVLKEKLIESDKKNESLTKYIRQRDQIDDNILRRLANQYKLNERGEVVHVATKQEDSEDLVPEKNLEEKEWTEEEDDEIQDEMQIVAKDTFSEILETIDEDDDDKKREKEREVKESIRKFAEERIKKMKKVHEVLNGKRVLKHDIKYEHGTNTEADELLDTFLHVHNCHNEDGTVPFFLNSGKTCICGDDQCESSHTRCNKNLDKGKRCYSNEKDATFELNPEAPEFQMQNKYNNKK